MKRSLAALAVVLSTAGALPADARVIPEVQRFVLEQMTHMGQAVGNGEGAGHWDGQVATQSYGMTLFALRIQALFGFDVAGIANISLVPEIELFWE